MLEYNKVYLGNSLELLKELEDNSIDSIVTDPPYELGFMGKSWDKTGIAYNVELWKECLRVLKPGGHLLSFGGTRTYHRMACAIEDAGFEIRDQIQWIYGSGMPKSLDVSRKIDEKLGSKRGKYDDPITSPAALFNGYGTGLKPSNEPILLARKPLSEKNVVENVLTYNTGALNIDDCRVPYEEGGSTATNPSMRKSINGGNGGKVLATEKKRRAVIPNENGRFPTNTIMDEHSLNALDEIARETIKNQNYDAKVSRFFYCPKPKGKDKDEYNTHPTVKPLELMKYLVRLATPHEGIVLDPFAGSGTTLLAAKNENKRYIGFEMNEEYIKIINQRINN